MKEGYQAYQTWYKEEIFYSEGAKELVAQRNCGCPIPEVIKTRLDGALANVV